MCVCVSFSSSVIHVPGVNDIQSSASSAGQNLAQISRQINSSQVQWSGSRPPFSGQVRVRLHSVLFYFPVFVLFHHHTSLPFLTTQHNFFPHFDKSWMLSYHVFTLTLSILLSTTIFSDWSTLPHFHAISFTSSSKITFLPQRSLLHFTTFLSCQGKLPH